jgi:glyoxylase I family protein
MKGTIMNLNQLHHVAIIVSDYNKSKHFYVDILGFQILRETIREDIGDIKLDLLFGESELEIFYKKDSPKRITNPEACGLRHLAFKVDNIESIVDELNEKGITCEDIRYDTVTNKKMTFFRDPDGLPLELHE